MTKNAVAKVWSLPVQSNGRRYSDPANVPAESFDYYISTTGSDSNDGTEGSPWAITALNTKQTTYAGKRVGLLDGTYTVEASDTDNWGGNTRQLGIVFTSDAAGTSEAPTIIESVNPRSAIIEDDSIDVLFLIERGADYIQLKNLRISPNTGLGIPIQPWGGNCRIEGIKFDPWHNGDTGGDNAAAIYCDAKDATPRIAGLVISNCWFGGVYNVSATEYSANSAAIIPMSTTGAIIEYCTAENTFQLFMAKYDCAGLTVRYNHLVNVDQLTKAFQKPVDDSERVQVYNNLQIGGGITGAYTYQDGADEVFPDIDYYNNTHVVAGGSEGILARWRRNSEDADTTQTGKFFNNIIALTSDPSSTYVFHNFGGSTGTGPYSEMFSLMDRNCYPSRNSNFFKASDGDYYTPDTSWTSLAAYQSATGFEANSIQADPVFTDGTGTDPDNYKLDSGSPCKSAGKSDGTSGGSNVDMGCWGGASPPTQIGSSF